MLYTFIILFFIQTVKQFKLLYSISISHSESEFQKQRKLGAKAHFSRVPAAPHSLNYQNGAIVF